MIKGGMLIAAMVGLDTRSTMDLDTTLRAYPLDEEHIIKALNEICEINLDDGVSFKFTGITAIRENDEYGGYRVAIESAFDTIITHLFIDISTGDAITPSEINYCFKAMFDEEKCIELYAYNIETILAEKVETVLRRSVFSTRIRDLYDIYILSKTQVYFPYLKRLNCF